MTETINIKQYRAQSKAKRSKYGNRKVVVEGLFKFDSLAEARRYAVLLNMWERDEIRDLVRQPKFILAPSVRIAGEARKRPAVRYSADFAYTEVATGERVIEDVKSAPTAKSKEFRRVQHLMQSVHGISIRIVR